MLWAERYLQCLEICWWSNYQLPYHTSWRSTWACPRACSFESNSRPGYILQSLVSHFCPHQRPTGIEYPLASRRIVLIRIIRSFIFQIFTSFFYAQWVSKKAKCSKLIKKPSPLITLKMASATSSTCSPSESPESSMNLALDKRPSGQSERNWTYLSLVEK